MAKPASKNLTYHEGDDETYSFALSQTVNGVKTPIDLTGATVEMAVKTDYTGNPGTITKATAVCSVIDGPSGLFKCELSKTDTRNMDGAKLKYDIQVTLNGKTRTYMAGEISGGKEVTE